MYTLLPSPPRLTYFIIPPLSLSLSLSLSFSPSSLSILPLPLFFSRFSRTAYTFHLSLLFFYRYISPYLLTVSSIFSVSLLPSFIYFLMSSFYPYVLSTILSSPSLFLFFYMLFFFSLYYLPSHTTHTSQVFCVVSIFFFIFLSTVIFIFSLILQYFPPSFLTIRLPSFPHYTLFHFTIHSYTFNCDSQPSSSSFSILPPSFHSSFLH